MAVRPPQMVGVDGDSCGAPAGAFDQSKVNAYRISVVIDRLSLHVRGAVVDTLEFLNLCLSLSRGIDFAIANYQVPSRAQELPPLLNQVCRCKNDPLLQSAIMVLMISVKNACQSGWFSDKDSVELVNLTKEIASNFCRSPNYDIEATCSPSTTSTIMSRFFPAMRMNIKLVSLEVKTGFDAYVSGFQISKNLKPSAGQKIRLLVAQTDDVITSSCLTSPSKVNFLLNGKGVEGRTTLSMDTGPQIPTDVTHMLKYGSNLLQAVGEFNGHYIITLAFMSDVPNPGSSALEDYEEHSLVTLESDSEIIEGPSRVLLNCPISTTNHESIVRCAICSLIGDAHDLKRIKTPVKGFSCKHIQCFDFDNYVDINSRRPSWRCPHCNQHVCFTDLRIDRKMVQILEEVGTDDTEVIVASDRSWSIATEYDDTMQKSVDKISNNSQDEPPQSGSVPFSNTSLDVLDLTDIDDSMDSVANKDIEDRKLAPTHPCQSTTPTMAVDSRMTNINDAIQSNAGFDEDFWSGIFLSTFGQESSDVQSNTQVASVSATPLSNIVPTPFLSHFVVPNTPNQEFEAVHGAALVTATTPQNETSSSTNLSSQQHQYGNLALSNEYGRYPSLPKNITRTPIGVQALPAQTSNSILQKRPRDSVNTFIPNSSSPVSQVSPPVQMIPNSSRVNPFYASQRSAPMHPSMGVQRNNSFPSIRSTQPNVRDQSRSSHSALNECRSSTPPHLIRLRMPSPAQSPANFSQSQSHIKVSRDQTNPPAGAVSGLARTLSSTHTVKQMARPVEASRTTPSYTTSSSHTVPSVRDQGSNPESTSAQVDTTIALDTADPNWRPASRMRGALSGQAYDDALNQYIIRPKQQAQAARPSPIPANVPAHLQSLMADRTAVSPGPGHSSGASASTLEVLSKLADISSGTK